MNPQPANSVSALLERRRRSLGPAYRLFYEEPLELVRGAGVWLTDSDGRRYLDMYNNVPHVGHCHPTVVAAICEQVGVLNTHTRYLHRAVVEYAERLTSWFPDPLSIAMFSCSGSEANELALRIARAATGARGIIVLEDAYHGTSQAAFEMSTEDNPRDLWPDYLEAVPAPNPYRGRYPGADSGAAYAALVGDAIEALARRGCKPAALVIDTIASSSGVVELPAGYLRQAARIVRAAGGLFVADEVQAGFGRTGAHRWGFEWDEVVPDIVTLGKPAGNGYPLATTISSAALVETFAKRFGYFNTFGGSPVAAAAGLAVLDVLEDENLLENACVVGSYLNQGLETLAARYPLIGDIRGNGLFLAVELSEDRVTKRPATEAAARIVNRLKDKGVLTSSIGPDANILKLRPPMVLAKDEADYFLQRFDQVLAEHE